jgi:hypothetical protein
MLQNPFLEVRNEHNQTFFLQQIQNLHDGVRFLQNKGIFPEKPHKRRNCKDADDRLPSMSQVVNSQKLMDYAALVMLNRLKSGYWRLALDNDTRN